MFREILAKLTSRRDLAAAEVDWLVRAIHVGVLAVAQIGGFLVALVM
jgi:anthranilate phosphoribosyltransferase